MLGLNNHVLAILILGEIRVPRLSKYRQAGVSTLTGLAEMDG